MRNAPTAANPKPRRPYVLDAKERVVDPKSYVVSIKGMRFIASANDNPTILTRPLTELGRIIKSVHVLRYVDGAAFRLASNSGDLSPWL